MFGIIYILLAIFTLSLLYFLLKQLGFHCLTLSYLLIKYFHQHNVYTVKQIARVGQPVNLSQQIFPKLNVLASFLSSLQGVTSKRQMLPRIVIFL